VAYDDTLGVGYWQQFCNWIAFPGVDQLNQTVTHTKCADFNDTEKQNEAIRTLPEWVTLVNGLMN